MVVLFLLVLASIITYPMPSVRIGGQPIAIVLAIYCLLYYAISRNGGRIRVKTIIPLFGLLVGYIFSSFVSGEFDDEFLINLIAFYIIFFTIANIAEQSNVDQGKREKNLKYSIGVLISSGVILGLYGYYGYITGKVGVEAESSWWSSMKYWGIHYTEATRNGDVHYIVFPLIALIVLEKKKIYHWILIMVLGSAVLLSMARNTWLCMIVVLLVQILLGKNIKKVVKYILVGIGGFIIAIILLQYFGMLDYFVQKVLSIFNRGTGVANSNSERLNIIAVTLKTIVKNPLGVGANQMYKYYNEAGLMLNHAENTYLNITAELGLIAAISYSYLVINPFKQVITKYKKDRAISMEERYVLLASLYMALTLLFNTETLNCYMWIIIALHWFIMANRRNNNDLLELIYEHFNYKV